MNVELTKQEIQALLESLDHTVKAFGLAVAPMAVLLAQKLAAAKAEQEPK